MTSISQREALLRALTNKEVKKYVKHLVQECGWELEPRGSGANLSLVAPDGKKLVLHTTSGSRNGAKALASRLRRRGYDVPKP